MAVGTAVLAIALLEKWLRLVFLGEMDFEADRSVADPDTQPTDRKAAR
jgi:hypothetical protein